MRTKLVLASLLCIAIGGCNSIGPRAMRVGRSSYNDALAETQSEQLLHNLIRIRYLEMPVFLEVTSVNTQYEMRSDMRASIGGIFDEPFDLARGDASLGTGIVERPTVTYAPLQGDDFVRRIMSPLGLDTLSLMVRSGWRLEHVMLVCLQSLGPAPNAPGAAGPAHEAQIDNDEFLRVVRLMGVAARSGGGTMREDGKGGFVMDLDVENPRVLEWLEAMGVPPAPTVPVHRGFSHVSPSISMQTRSLLAAMFYLSLGIDLPPAHVETGEVPIPPDPRFRDITSDFFNVRSSESAPERAFIKTKYRDHWYYIDDTDHRSKATFALLTLLFSLQSGSREAAHPAITIPLN